ncbi:MAG: hypothetical protein ACI9JM_003152 [Halioglobus sp.]|jgi:hypothetical protein
MDSPRNAISKSLLAGIIALNLSLATSIAIASDGLLPATFNPTYIFAVAALEIALVLAVYRATRKQPLATRS